MAVLTKVIAKQNLIYQKGGHHEKTNLFFGVILLSSVFCFSIPGMAQELEPGEVFPELNEEQKFNRFTVNMNAMLFAILNYVDKHGQSVEEAGRLFCGKNE